MKTIEVEDSLFERLIALSTEINTQNNRCTATPYLFQIRTDEKVYDSEGLNGDVKVILSADWEEVGEFNQKTIRQICKEEGVGRPYFYKDVKDLIFLDWDEVRDWLNSFDMRLSSYTIKHKLENGFLTEKACKAHIKANHYHYDNPTDYLSHAFRNPDLETVFTFLKGLTAGKEGNPS
ncbi:hypothetical protein GCM10027347_52910 [Larkinella harenae]